MNNGPEASYEFYKGLNTLIGEQEIDVD